MIDLGKKNVLGVRVDAIDYEAAVEKIMAAAGEGRSLTVAALAVHGVMTGVQDETHRYRLNALDLVAPDGQPVRWALNLLHHTSLKERVYGPTLMHRVCERAARDGVPVYFYGSSGEVLAKLRENLLRRHPALPIAGLAPSFFRRISPEEKLRAARAIEESGARITFVGLGCPRQEVWVYEHRAVLRMPTVAVGAAFDFHAGTLARAPRWMQRAGLEWLFRLGCEPRRLWKRYLLLNPLWASMVALQWSGLREFPPAACRPPTGETRYG